MERAISAGSRFPQQRPPAGMPGSYAAMTNLSDSSTFRPAESIVPSNSGVKHLLEVAN